MRIKHTVNKGHASVDDELGAKLIESDLWELVEPPKEAPAPKAAAAK